MAKKNAEARKVFVRVVCIVLAVLMVSSSIMAMLGIFS